MIGLELYKRPVLDFIVETAVITGGWLVYRRSLPEDRRSSPPAMTLLAVLILIQIGTDIVLSVATGMRKC